MPLVFKEKINNKTLALWHLTESLDEIVSLSQTDTFDQSKLTEISNETRKKEWLSVRVLLHHALGYWPQVRHTEFGRPCLLNSTLNLSITHSKKMVGVLLAPSENIGLDIEQTNRNIDRILSRFLSGEEETNIKKSGSNEMKIIHWCSKEAIFKAVNEQAIEFSEQIHISEVLNDIPYGNIIAHFHAPDGNQHPHELHFMNLMEHTIVWTK